MRCREKRERELVEAVRYDLTEAGRHSERGVAATW